jgi:hypothetical protein
MPPTNDAKYDPIIPSANETVEQQGLSRDCQGGNRKCDTLQNSWTPFLKSKLNTYNIIQVSHFQLSYSRQKLICECL